MANEVELKLFFPAEDLPEIESRLPMAGASSQGEAEVLENTYFDTPELLLYHKKIAVRTRQTGTGILQTIKCAAASVGGLSSRPEWEKAFDGAFDFSEIDNPEVLELLEAEKARLVPVFTTTFQRKTWLVEPGQGIAISLMLDSGSISSGMDRVPVSELELELVRGSGLDLQDFAINLAGNLPLIPFDQSKAERGYQLFLHAAPRPVKAGKTPVSPAMNPYQAFRALATQGLQCWQANLLGALTIEDPEYVHQFRVALRRLNTLMKVFKPALPNGFFATWSESLKALSGITGDVRDLDVMKEVILLPMLGSGKESKELLLHRAIEACDAAREVANGSFDRLKSGQPLLMFARDIYALPSGSFPNKLERFAETRLSRLYENAGKRLRAVIKSPTPESAHRFRISLKHLRYACEFFSDVFDDAQMLQYAKAVAALQDEFGFLNDLHVALSRLGKWSEGDSQLDKARTYVAGWHAEHADEKLAAALALAESVMTQCQPWCGECERRGMSGLRKRLRQGISIKIE